MSADIIDFLDTTKPLPVLDTKHTTVKWCGDAYRVQTTIDIKTRRGFQIVVEAKSNQSVLVRPCGENDDPQIVQAAIVGWRAGIRRGRQQMCEEIELPA